MFVIATRARAQLAGELHRLDRVARLARLRDPDHERVLVDHRVAVDPLGRDVRLDRDPRPLLDHVAADDARVVGGAAGEDDDPAQLAQLVLGEPEPLEHERAVADAVADRLGDGLGLLVDLLEHERLVAALLGALVVPVELDRVVLDRRAVRAREDGAGGRDLDDVAVVGERRRGASRCRKAAAFEARNISPSPIPTTSGVWWRAATSRSGWSWWMTTNVKWPSSSLNVRRTASARSPS